MVAKIVSTFINSLNFPLRRIQKPNNKINFRLLPFLCPSRLLLPHTPTPSIMDHPIMDTPLCITHHPPTMVTATPNPRQHVLFTLMCPFVLRTLSILSTRLLIKSAKIPFSWRSILTLLTSLPMISWKPSLLTRKPPLTTTTIQEPLRDLVLMTSATGM